MESPPSDKVMTRFSTPASELDDHRQHLALPPPANTPMSPTSGTRPRAGTARSSARMDPGNALGNLAETGTKAKDFEQAIIDDDAKSAGDEGLQSPGGNPNRAFSRRIQHRLEEMGRAREASPSDRSSSPPNSVDAFAEPRRRERANTFCSQGSDVENPLQRTVSGGTRGRRPTFDNISTRPAEIEDGRPEEDVCFPVQEEPSKTFKIDYEEIEEFVALHRRDRKASTNHEVRDFDSQSAKGRVFNALNQPNGVGIPSELDPALGHVSPKQEKDSGCELDEKATIVDNETINGRQFDRHAGAEPNRFSFFSSEIEQTIYAQDIGDLIMHDETFRDLFELPSESGAWWLDVMNPTEDEMDMFQKAFGIHRLTAEDIETKESREKVELFHQYYFVCFRSFHQMDKESENYLDPINVYMVVFREGILTFTYAPSPHAAEVRKRIGRLRNYINLTADWICYAMVDNIVDCFQPVIRNLEVETDQIEDSVFVARSDDFSSLLRNIGDCRKKVMTLMRLLGGKADVIKGFAKRCNEQFGVAPRGEIGLYLGDIQDHVVTMMSNLGHFEKMLSRSHSNYLAQLSVDQIQQGTRANEVLGKITLIATVLVPLNLICGLFGMNVPVPGGVNDGSLGWFFGIVGVIAAIVIVSMILAKKAKFF